MRILRRLRLRRRRLSSSSSVVVIAVSLRDDMPCHRSFSSSSISHLSSQTREGVELLHNNDIHIQNKTHLYCIRFARILQYYQSFDY